MLIVSLQQDQRHYYKERLMNLEKYYEEAEAALLPGINWSEQLLSLHQNEPKEIMAG